MSHKFKHNSDEIRGELEGAALGLCDSPEHNALRVTLNVLWKLNENLVTISQNHVEAGKRIDKLTKEVHQMDVSGLESIAKIMTDAATSLNASATAILAKTDTSKADQDQLNAALGTLSTAAQAVAVAAKAVADAVTPQVV